MTQHDRGVANLAELVDRYQRALNVMEGITREAEGRPDWRFLQSRVRELENRIQALCEGAQVAMFERQGFYAPQRKAGAA